MTVLAEKTKHLEQALRDAGLRMTRQRLVLLEVIAGASDHPDAAELHKRVQARDAGVSLATVYRTLSELEAQGVIQRHAFDGASSRFETADEGSRPRRSRTGATRCHTHVASATDDSVKHANRGLYSPNTT